MFDSWVGELTDKLAAGVATKLLTLVQILLHGIGWGTILIAIGAMFALILIVKTLCKTRVLLALALACLIGGYLLSKGVSFDVVRSYVASVVETRSE